MPRLPLGPVVPIALDPLFSAKLPSLLIRLVLPPGVPGKDAGGVDRPAPCGPEGRGV